MIGQAMDDNYSKWVKRRLPYGAPLGADEGSQGVTSPVASQSVAEAAT